MSARTHTIYVSPEELASLRAERGTTKVFPRKYEVHTHGSPSEKRVLFGLFHGARRTK